MEKEYRVLSFSEGRELGISELYSCLVGPDEFECTLTEIEDRTWGRDLRPVVNRLKEQHARIAELEAQLASAQERELLLSNDLVYALDLAIAYAPAKADQEWAAEMMEQLSPLKEA